jgi:hypothetical protein
MVLHPPHQWREAVARPRRENPPAGPWCNACVTYPRLAGKAHTSGTRHSTRKAPFPETGTDAPAASDAGNDSNRWIMTRGRARVIEEGGPTRNDNAGMRCVAAFWDRIHLQPSTGKSSASTSCAALVRKKGCRRPGSFNGPAPSSGREHQGNAGPGLAASPRLRTGGSSDRLHFCPPHASLTVPT